MRFNKTNSFSFVGQLVGIAEDELVEDDKEASASVNRRSKSKKVRRLRLNSALRRELLISKKIRSFDLIQP
jgi:hypothetical protein